ncbi:MAG: response regulator [Salibacteraceae bacterium]
MERIIKLTIADDHSLFRKGLSSMINECEGIDLIQEAGNGRELIDSIEKDNYVPHVILMDLKMPQMDGIEATKYLKAVHPDIKIIVLSMYDDDKFIIHMIESGANGYLLKNADAEEVQNSIHAVMTNGYYFNDHVSTALLKGLVRKKKIVPSFNNKIHLTAREFEVLKMICDQMTNVEMAKKLCLSARTIEGYRKKLLVKIGAKNTAGLVMYAVKNNLVDLD